MPSCFYSYQSVFGSITVCANEDSILSVDLDKCMKDGEFAPNSLTNKCANELFEYFSGKRTTFDLPYELIGSDFQKRVYSAIADIPYGQTRTYKEIADVVGHPKSFRSVGIAVKSNPLAVLVPAHRVIPASGYIDRNDRSEKLKQAFRMLERRNT